MTPTSDATNDIYGPAGHPTVTELIAQSAMRGGGPASGGAGSRVQVAGSQRQTGTHGSRTMILDPTEIEEDAEASHEHGVLELTGESSTARRVQWEDDVVDNEHMGKKKSKICCIFKKQKEFGESSDESSSDSDSDSGSESDGGPVGSNGGHGKGKGKGADKDADESCDHSDPNHQHHHHHGPKKARKRVLNEYERMPKVKSTVPLPVNQPPSGSDAQK